MSLDPKNSRHGRHGASRGDEVATTEKDVKPGRAQFIKALFAVPRTIHLVLVLLCFILGFALMTTVRAQREYPLEALSEQDLVVLLSELNSQENNLRQERSALQQQVDEIEANKSEQEAAAQTAQKINQLAQINAGRVPVEGPGVLMHIGDDANRLTATEFVMTLGELRNAGAEAIELNGVRLSTRSAFTSDNNTIAVDGVVLSQPYDWHVIGEGQTIATALEIQAGSAAQMRAKGANVTISVVGHISIDSVSSVPQPQYAVVDTSEDSKSSDE